MQIHKWNKSKRINSIQHISKTEMIFLLRLWKIFFGGCKIENDSESIRVHSRSKNEITFTQQLFFKKVWVIRLNSHRKHWFKLLETAFIYVTTRDGTALYRRWIFYRWNRKSVKVFCYKWWTFWIKYLTFDNH